MTLGLRDYRLEIHLLESSFGLAGSRLLGVPSVKIMAKKILITRKMAYRFNAQPHGPGTVKSKRKPHELLLDPALTTGKIRRYSMKNQLLAFCRASGILVGTNQKI